MAQATIDTTVAGLQGVPISPAVPTAGQALVFNGTVWIPTNPPANLPLSGGTLTGPLVLSGNAVAALNPVTLQQLQANYLLLTGGTVTGALTVNGALTANGGTITNGFSSTNGASVTGNVSIDAPAGSPAAVSVVTPQGTNCAIYSTVSNVRAWWLGTGGANGSFYIGDNNAGAIRGQCDTGGNWTFSGFFNFQGPAGSAAQPLTDNSMWCGRPGGYAWAGVGSYDFAQQSDPRNKIDLKDAPSGALEQVKAIPVKTYYDKPPSDEPVPRTAPRQRTGFSAADIATVHPNAVNFIDGEASAYSLSDMNALLWQAVQELAAQVASLQGAK